MTKRTCENDLKTLDAMLSSAEYDHSKLVTICNRYGLTPPEEEERPEDPEEALMWNDPFEGIAIVARTVVNEYYYTNFTDRQYILKGGVRTYWNGNPVNNADCTDEQLAQYLQEGLEPLLFLTYPGKE